MRKKRAIVFDFDGTLCLSYPLCEGKLVEALSKFRSEELSEEEKRLINGPTEEGIIKVLIKNKGKARKCFYEYLRLYSKAHEELLKDFVPGMRELLEELNLKGVNVYLLTGRCKETTVISLSKLDGFKYFKSMYTGGIDGAIKDQTLKELAEDEELALDEILYVGDALSDVTQCKKVGVDIISVSYNDPLIHEKLEELNPGNVSKNVKELRAKILDLI